jgi:pantoate--beta-alanine ligase
LVSSPLEKAADSIDYVELADHDNLRLFGEDETLPGKAVLAVAARVGRTRLIDNVVLGEDPAPA